MVCLEVYCDSGHYILVEHERNYGLGMMLQSPYSFGTNGIIVKADMFLVMFSTHDNKFINVSLLGRNVNAIEQITTCATCGKNAPVRRVAKTLWLHLRPCLSSL